MGEEGKKKVNYVLSDKFFLVFDFFNFPDIPTISKKPLTNTYIQNCGGMNENCSHRTIGSGIVKRCSLVGRSVTRDGL